MSLSSFIVELRNYDITLKDFNVLMQKSGLRESDLKSADGDLGELIDILERNAEKPTTTTEKPTTSTLSTTTLLSPVKAKEQKIRGRGKPTSVERTISLSEILQDLDMVLPRFLVALKSYDISLKEFTTLLQQNGLHQSDLKKSRGDLGKIIKILRKDREDDDKTPETSSKQDSKVSENKPTSIPSWLTQGPLWVSTTSKPSDTKNIVITTSSPVKGKSTTPSIHKFGFRPEDNEKRFVKQENDTDKNEELQESENPISVKLDIAKIMKEQDLKPTEILSSMFSLPGSVLSKDIDASLINKNDISSEITTPFPYTLPQGVSLKPYEGSSGAEVYKPRRTSYGRGDSDGGGRGIIRSRFSSTARTTLYPKYKYSPRPVSYNEEVPNHINSFANSEELIDSSVEIEDIQDTVRNNENRNLFNKYFNRKQEVSNNISSKSAIMAGAILGGVALIVFATILVVVMCRNYMQRMRHRIPIPLPSDTSSSSSPPIYMNRKSLGKGPYKTSGFWGTLKKRFDPYSLSSTPTSMK